MMQQLFLVNPSIATPGFSFFTPRWLYVLAQVCPEELTGRPVIVDEALEGFQPHLVEKGDIVAVGVTSGGCRSAYRVMRQARERGAIVIAGGVHATIFPEEPLEMGANAVVTGNADVIFRAVVEDAVSGRLRPRYDGGRVPGEMMAPARWELLDPARYLFPTVQTVAGCPENCSFCSVWVTDGRTPRMRHADQIIQEANQLYQMGFRYIAFADDNFGPATIGRIRREPSRQIRKQLEQVREERLRFFAHYSMHTPPDLFGITQITSEVASDEEYLDAVHEKMRLRAALIGVESFSDEGLASARKSWNPSGERMVETIRRIQDRGILVLSSIICGLETDTLDTLRTMREFACSSGALLAQFTFYAPYPGTVDHREMVQDAERRQEPGYKPKHRVELLADRFWLNPRHAVDIVKHPHLERDEWLRENLKCWSVYYSIRETLRRLRQPPASRWPWAGKVVYLVACIAFRRVYGGNGMSADAENRTRYGLVTKLLVRLGVGIYLRFRRSSVPVRVAVDSSPIHQNEFPSALVNIHACIDADRRL